MPFEVQTLTVGEDGISLLAGTDSTVYRSDDGGETWKRMITDKTLEGFGETWGYLSGLDVRSLVVGNDSRSLFAGIYGGGVLRSDDGGETWQPINNGLGRAAVLKLSVGPDEGDLFAEVLGGQVYHSDDAGLSWQLVPDMHSLHMQASAVFGNVHMVTIDGRVNLARSGTGWMPWATYRDYPPQAIMVDGNRATVYAYAGPMVLRAEASLPFLWRTPIQYQRVVTTTIAVTRRAINWVVFNAFPLSIGIGITLFTILTYIYVGVARPNRLSTRTVLWLLPRPRYLVTASGYQSYAQRWAAGDPLERLALLRVPTYAPFTLDQLIAELRREGAACDTQGLRASLTTLTERGLLRQEDDAWILTEPLLTQIKRHELPPDTPVQLAKEIRQQHPLYIRTRDFFTQARFRMKELSAEEFLFTPQGQDHPQVAYGSIYTRLIAGRTPTGEDFTAICEATHAHYGDDLPHRVALLLSDRRPEPGARYRLYEIRQREGLAIVPLDVALFRQIKPNRTANDILASEVDQATGQQNLYAISGPVSGDLSFFGREHVLQETLDLLEMGQPVGLFGLRKMGKTSLIQRLQGRLAQQRPIAMVDTQKTAQQQGIWSLYPDIIAAFADHLQRYRPDIDLPELHLWPETPTPSPALADAFMQDLHALHTALGAPDEDKRLLLIVDEIDRLLPAGDAPGYEGFTTLFGQLRAANQQARMLDFLVVGVDAAVNRIERWQDHDNELYRALREVWVPPMAHNDVCEMIESLGSQMGVRYESGSLHLLATSGGGQPFVTRQLCSWAVQGRLGQGAITVTAEQARIAIEEFIFGDPYLREMWDKRLDDTQREMLRALAQASEPLPRLELLPASQRQGALAALGAIEDYTLVNRADGGYTIAWDVFDKWIRWIELGLED